MHDPTAPSPGGSSAFRKPRLLLAEDEPSLSDFLCEVLHADYEVEVATEGEQAWALVQHRLPDLLLTDVRMPGLSGIELTRRLRADPRTARVPILLLTASNERETQAQGLAAGADHLLLKPFRPWELLDGLRALLKTNSAAVETARGEITPDHSGCGHGAPPPPCLVPESGPGGGASRLQPEQRRAEEQSVTRTAT